jgi:hypothetical protein
LSAISGANLYLLLWFIAGPATLALFLMTNEHIRTAAPFIFVILLFAAIGALISLDISLAIAAEGLLSDIVGVYLIALISEGRTEATKNNEACAIDFVHDQLVTGSKLRILTIVDTFSRFSPATDPRFSYRGEDVVRTLARMCRQHNLSMSEQPALRGSND